MPVESFDCLHCREETGITAEITGDIPLIYLKLRVIIFARLPSYS
jgi:hypothetical protein